VAAQGLLAGALEAGPRDPPLLLAVAAVHERSGDLARAADGLSEVLAIDPGHLEAQRRLGSLQERLGDMRAAARSWRRVVEATGGQDLAALTRLGISLSAEGQHAEAVQILRDVAARRSDAGAPFADLGFGLLGAGSLEEAIAAFTRARSLDPRSPQAHCGLGLAYQRQGRFREAADAFRTTEQLAPDNATGPFNLGLALDALGDREGARRALLRAAALEPDDEEIRGALAQFIAADEPRPQDPPSVEIPPLDLQGSMRGELTSFQMFDILEFLRLQKKTGALVLQSAKGSGIVRLADGAVTGATAPGLKRLGQVLVDQRIIDRTQLEAALAKQRDEQKDALETLGSVLLRQGLVGREQLAKAVLQQIMAALDEMLTWTEGAFSFHPGANENAPPVSFDLQEVMLELMRTTDERKQRRMTPAPS
jgi:Flp pilus assembly protein TadD